MTIPTEPIGSIPKPSALKSFVSCRGDRRLPPGEFIDDLLQEHETEFRRSLQEGAPNVQIDFTEGRLAVKIDSTGSFLHSFIDLNNLALSRFSAEDQRRIGVRTCPGCDRDSGFSPFCDDTSTTRETAFAKIRARVFGTALAAEALSRN
jgi:5-methyltetrahydropteroyltriglutamate--homocysteine methyltransferase